MATGVLLDTNALYWLVSGEQALTDEAGVAIAEAQAAKRLFVSPVSAWELAMAAQKPAHRDPVKLGDHSPSRWFSAAVKSIDAQLIAIKLRISIAAASVVFETGHKDPGDCYLIATARVRQIPLVTRDAIVLALGKQSYLQTIKC